jgi:hypothetical protein
MIGNQLKTVILYSFMTQKHIQQKSAEYNTLNFERELEKRVIAGKREFSSHLCF